MTAKISLHDNTHSLIAHLIKENKFYEAYQMILQKDAKEIVKILTQIATEKGIIAYTFVNFILQRKETSFWHKIAAQVISHLQAPHHKIAAVYHLKKSIQLDPADWTAQEELLKYYDEGLISQEEAFRYAKHVLVHNPTHQTGKKLIGIG
ncbi:MAG: hypothetical protein NZM38_09240 [Cytophagales bacterium]|nr:hypothetical protein [Cytophagales bacterium]MDW8384942.1 hypothetical protein [Flammeovirgaceae bacterium]